MALRLTVYGFYRQYQGLHRAACFGSGAQAGYGFLASTLKRVSCITTAISAVQARLISLGREANNSRGRRQKG